LTDRTNDTIHRTCPISTGTATHSCRDSGTAESHFWLPACHVRRQRRKARHAAAANAANSLRPGHAATGAAV